jgi:paraquat-inducible protein B
MESQSIQQNSYSPTIKKDKGISPLWILPLLTLALASWLVIKAVNDSGQSVQIYFSDAQGLIAGRTTIRYQGLEVGIVRDINLSESLDSIYVDADIFPEALKLLSEDTKFWLVKPTASLSGVSGLDALVSGNYISVMPGNKEPDELARTFTALDSAPLDIQSNKGLDITLRSDELSSISVGSSILFKKIPIGEVYAFSLDENDQSVIIQANIESEYEHLIRSNSRFWNVSGLTTNIGFQGVDLKLESLGALIGGAIAVDSPLSGESIKPKHEFTLYDSMLDADSGLKISIELPENSQINSGASPILYKGLKIGSVTKVEFNDDRSKLIATASIQPIFGDLLKSSTQFLIEEPEVSLNGISNIANFVTGNFLSIIPGNGEFSTSFIAVTQERLSLEDSNKTIVTLSANQSYGLSANTPVLYKGIRVGKVSTVELIKEKVQIKLHIDEQYKHLIKQANQFYIEPFVSTSFGSQGLSLSLSPLSQVVSGALSFKSIGKPGISDEYKLYENKELADLAQYWLNGYQKLSLVTDNLPSISKGSPLLYRNLEVGKVSDYSLTKSGMKIDVLLNNQYKHLLTDNTVFWNHSGIDIKASLSQVTVNSGSLKSIALGGIAFDSIDNVQNRTGKNWLLYDSLDAAKSFGGVVTLVSQSNGSISNGTKLKFQNVDVGEVISSTPDFGKNQVLIKARIYPEYFSQLAVQKTEFKMLKPVLSLTEIKDLSAAIIPVIKVIPGDNSTPRTLFNLDEVKKASNNLILVLQSENKRSVTKGTPVLFRDIEVGRVTNVELGSLADRVISTIEIDQQYAYLVRKNSVFWNVSGVDVSFGLSGANIKAGTVDSLLRGGIAFSTPENVALEAPAKQNSSFFLYDKAQEGWSKWRTAIPKP